MQESESQNRNLEERKGRGWTHRATPIPGYLSLKDAATWSGVSGRTIKRWIAAGLPIYQERPRSKILIRPQDIELFLTKRQVPRPDLNAIVSQVITEMEGKAKS